MQFRIADTFSTSLTRLNNDEQKAVKITVFDLQSDPTNPGIQLHRIERSKDPNFWSARVNRDIRLIIHKTDASLLVCYVDHHDDAYEWARRRRIETHPRTGAAQLVEVRETVKEIVIPKYVEDEIPVPAKPPLLQGVKRDEFLDYGVPEDWIDDLLQADEDGLFKIVDHLPGEAAEAVLELATGGRPQIRTPDADEITQEPFEHPDAQRRFRVVADTEELQQALDYPWDRWTVFLHPAQREIVEKDFSGPARVAGSAGTGKTVVAIHRAANLAKDGKRVLLTTFSTSLARSLTTLLGRLVPDQHVRGLVAVRSLHDFAEEQYEARHGKPQVPTESKIRMILREAMKEAPDTRFSLSFIVSEWEEIIDAWQVNTWEEYKGISRLGRKSRLAEKHRSELWEVFAGARQKLSTRGLVTHSMMLSELAESFDSDFDAVVVDEAQDISVPQLRLLSRMAGDKKNGLFFAGDLGQRIFRAPFSWKALGVDVRGRSSTLRVNYRTSHQIRMVADRLLPPEIADVDGLSDSRGGTVSVFSGPQPVSRVFESKEDESKAISAWLSECIDEGMKPGELAIFVRSRSVMERAITAVSSTGLAYCQLDGAQDADLTKVNICTMHNSKGLEFRAVAVMACDDQVLPLKERIEAVNDESELENVYDTERHLLYVACTRARDRLMATGVHPASEFLDDLDI